MDSKDNKQDDMFPCESRTSTPEYRMGYENTEWVDYGTKTSRKGYADLIKWENATKGKDNKSSDNNK